MTLSRGFNRVLIPSAVFTAGVIISTCRPTTRYTEPPASSYSIAQHVVAVDSSSETLAVASVTPEFFSVSGLRPLLGRSFSDNEYRADPAIVRVAMLSHDFWTRRFAGQPSALGRQIVVAGGQVTIVGVAPPDFPFGKDAAIWIPAEQR